MDSYPVILLVMNGIRPNYNESELNSHAIRDKYISRKFKKKRKEILNLPFLSVFVALLVQFSARLSKQDKRRSTYLHSKSSD